MELQKFREQGPDFENMGPKERKVYSNSIRTYHEFENDCLSRLFYIYQVQKWDNIQPQNLLSVNEQDLAKIIPKIYSPEIKAEFTGVDNPIYISKIQE